MLLYTSPSAGLWNPTFALGCHDCSPGYMEELVAVDDGAFLDIMAGGADVGLEKL